ncbi:hypothetical protein PR048_031867 [Dryococelus australis]|uniref:Uncharacterized protein n=1 Tax=Dryococelus australis TaxID=614101 RepID=A0ABQ9G6H2_9NEOP|nr:hypothetical protein PR048_031867 [Dryococelus australis]
MKDGNNGNIITEFVGCLRHYERGDDHVTGEAQARTMSQSLHVPQYRGMIVVKIAVYAQLIVVRVVLIAVHAVLSVVHVVPIVMCIMITAVHAVLIVVRVVLIAVHAVLSTVDVVPIVIACGADCVVCVVLIAVHAVLSVVHVVPIVMCMMITAVHAVLIVLRVVLIAVHAVLSTVDVVPIVMCMVITVVHAVLIVVRVVLIDGMIAKWIEIIIKIKSKVTAVKVKYQGHLDIIWRTRWLMVKSDSRPWTPCIDLAYPMSMKPILPPLLSPREAILPNHPEWLNIAFLRLVFARGRLGTFLKEKW